MIQPKRNKKQPPPEDIDAQDYEIRDDEEDDEEEEEFDEEDDLNYAHAPMYQQNQQQFHVPQHFANQ